MARSAIVRQAKLHVRRVVAAHKVRGVAGIALSRRSRKHIIDMACGASQRGMRAGERVTCVLQVIELCTHKVVHRVAGIARRREIKRHVIDDRRQEVLLMA